jgi:hypothetical protein
MFFEDPRSAFAERDRTALHPADYSEALAKRSEVPQKYNEFFNYHKIK